MMEKNLKPMLGICVTLLVVSLGFNGTLLNQNTQLSQQINKLESEKSQLRTQISNFQNQIETLESNYLDLRSKYETIQKKYTYLQSHSFTYYVADNKLNITDLQIDWGWFTTIKGNITNISNTPIEIVYVYVIVRNQDGAILLGTLSSLQYDKLENLYIGETMPFEVEYWIGTLTGNEIIEILLIY